MQDQAHSHTITNKLDSGWSRPSRDQKNVLFIGGALCLLAYSQARWLGAAPLLIVMLFLYAPIYGRRKGFKHSGIDGLIAYFEARKLRRRGGQIYATDLADTTFKFESSEQPSPPKRKPPLLKTELISLVASDSQQRFAFLRDSGGKSDHLIAYLVFDGGPKFVNSDVAQRFVWDKVYVSALKRGVNTTVQEIELCQMVIGRQADRSQPVTYADERWHEDFLNSQPGSHEERMVSNAAEDFENVYADGKEYLCAIGIRMEFPKQWKNKDLNKLSLDQIRSTDLMRVVNTIQANLSGAVTNLRLPSLFELNELNYLVFNAVELDGFYAQQRLDINRELKGELQKLEDAPTLKRGPFPGLVGVGNDSLLVNKTWHSSIGLMGFDGSNYEPGYLDTLFNQPFPFIYSQYVRTFPRRRGMRKTRFRVRGQSFLRGLLGRGGSRELFPEDDEAEAEVNLQHLGLFYSKSRSTEGRIQFTVQAAGHEQLQTDVQLAIGSLSNHSIIGVQLLGEMAQLPPLLAHLGIFDE